MQVIPLSLIAVDHERQRKSVPAHSLAELRESIASIGLLHPPVVEALEDGTYRLLAGERRLRAITDLESSFRHHNQDIPPGHVPVTLYSDLSPTERVEIELHENIRRLDISWQEKSAALARLHALRHSQNPTQTISDTAREVMEQTDSSKQAAVNRISRALLIAEHADDPIVKNAGSESEAHKAILARMEAEFANKLAASRPSTSSHTFHRGDMRQLLAETPAESFDVILADPPYGMNTKQFRLNRHHHYEEDELYSLEISKFIISEGFRVAKPQACLFLFCDIDFFIPLRDEAADKGWEVWRTPLIWTKGTGGIEPIPGKGFQRAYELILFAVKGNRARAQNSLDVLDVPRQKTIGHSAAKPVELYRRLLARSGHPGDSVLDPCCGVGTVFHAARALQWKATGFEREEGYASLAQQAANGAPETLE